MAVSRLVDGINENLNWTRTENGALTYKSTTSATLDLFSTGAARRGQDIKPLFAQAFAENENDAILTAFWMRDARGGAGERKLAMDALAYLADVNPDKFLKVFKFIPEYGYWKDLFNFVWHEKVGQSVIEFILLQLKNDVEANNPSLLAKYMPSENASSRNTRRLAGLFAGQLGWSFRKYRKTLSALRAKLDVVERRISANDWSNIVYAHVPSYAAKNLKKAFKKHDGTRYDAYLAKVLAGDEKINSSVLFPYDLVHDYLINRRRLDDTVEAQWKNLPNYADTEENALVIADVSGSMFAHIKPSPISVCVSLAIYIAERNKGLFKDHFMTFTSSPSLEKITGQSLYEKVHNLAKADWGGSTDLQAALNLILDTAVKKKLEESEMPTKLFIISDMEFNACVNGGTNFDNIKAKYENAGYKLPQVIFWHVSARGQKAAAKRDENGVFLISGASPAIFKSAINAKAVTPYELMLEVLNSQRYEPVRQALQSA